MLPSSRSLEVRKTWAGNYQVRTDLFLAGNCYWPGYYDDMDLNTPIIAVGWFSGPHMASVAVVAWPLRWAARHPTAFASDSSCNTQLVRALLPLETDKWESNDEACMKDVAFSGIHFPRCSLTLEISTNCVGVKCGHPDPDMDNSNDAACHTEQPFGYLALSLQYV